MVMCKYISIIKFWRITGAVSIILGIIGKKRKHNRKILENSRLKPRLNLYCVISPPGC